MPGGLNQEHGTASIRLDNGVPGATSRIAAQATEAAGIGQSLGTLAQQPFGRALLGVVALGLVAYGLYQVGTARYRRMRVA